MFGWPSSEGSVKGISPDDAKAPATRTDADGQDRSCDLLVFIVLIFIFLIIDRAAARVGGGG